MPRAASSSSGPTLRRNQACRTCRKKKLKCDASRPHCGQCVKHWKGIISVPAPDGYAHPEEPQCSYDPIEGLTLAESINPADKIRQLEEQISDLKHRLQEAGALNAQSANDASFSNHTSPAAARLASLAPQSFIVTSPDSMVTAPPLPRQEISLPRAGLDVTSSIRSTSPASQPRSSTSSPEIQGGGPEAILKLIAHGWNPDLPDPMEMRRIIDVFFTCDPCGSRILHRPSFLASMDLSPKDPRFPHSALLHAICASASRWISTDAFMTPDGIRRDTFADYHAGKTRQYIDRTMASGADIFHVLQACIIISWYFYSEGRWVEVWIFAGFQTRVAVPLRLNHPGTFTTHGSGSPGAYLAPPKDQKDLEMRRRTWWMSIIFDRIVSVGGWLHAIEYKHIATEMPLRRRDFETDKLIPSNPQNLYTPDVFTTHRPQYTDSFLLLIKAVMLFGEVTDHNTEYQLQHPTSPRKTDDPYVRPAFHDLDKLVAEDFLSSLPDEFKNYLFTLSRLQNADAVDTDLYLVHLVPHAATITLHNPYLNFEDMNIPSTRRCLAAADAILDAYYVFQKATAYSTVFYPRPITKLHPFATICWYLAAVVKVQVCKYMIEIGEAMKEIEVWGEINALRNAMIEFGEISPVGTRQERLLKTLMNEIVNRTKQEKPLEISSRLYPFSHTSVFEGPNSSGFAEKGVGAPLPATPPVATPSTMASPNMGLSSVQVHVSTQMATSHTPSSAWSTPPVEYSQSPPSHPSSSSSYIS